MVNGHLAVMRNGSIPLDGSGSAEQVVPCASRLSAAANVRIALARQSSSDASLESYVDAALTSCDLAGNHRRTS
jgi:hypothetical protein